MKLPGASVDIPGVGRRNMLNVGNLFALFAGLVVLALVWGYAQIAAVRARGFIGGLPVIGSVGKAAAAPATEGPVDFIHQ